MELIQVGARTYYVKNATNIGIYRTNDIDVYLIDAGNDQDAGKTLLRMVAEQGWQVKGILSTHSNADHIGGNQIIQQKTGCPVYAHGIEAFFTTFPEMEPSFLWGGYPLADLNNKFLLAKSSVVTELDGNLPAGISAFSLKGHFFDMVGFKTDDDVYFIADSLFCEYTITKYHVCFLYDVQAFLHTLDFLSTLKGNLFIPSHCEATNDLSTLIALNRQKVEEIIQQIYTLCERETTFEQILKGVFETYNLRMNATQYALVGSTVRSYLSYLYHQKRLHITFRNNVLYWSQC